MFNYLFSAFFLIENANTDVYVHRLCVSNAPDIDHGGGCFYGIFI